MTKERFLTIKNYHQNATRRSSYLVYSAALLSLVGLVILGYHAAALYSRFGLGLLVGSFLPLVEGLIMRSRFRYHLRKIAGGLSSATLFQHEQEQVAFLTTSLQHMRNRTTYLLIGLVVCTLVGAFTPFAFLISISALSLLLPIAVVYLYSLAEDYQLSSHIYVINSWD